MFGMKHPIAHMPRGLTEREARRKSFKQADLTRAIKAASNAGLNVSAVSICPNGNIELRFDADENESTKKNGWDQAIKKRQ